ncbi:MAG: GDSL-type esterase/lipase family protein [Singulisphaera sp.]
MSGNRRWLAFVLGILCLANAHSLSAVTLDGFAAMGASETAGNDVTGSWVPYAQIDRGLNFGGPGYPYNVAVGGATTVTLLQQQQHTQVASLVQSGAVDMAFISIGGNDFSAVSGQILTGSLSGAALVGWAQGVVDNIDTAVDTVLAQHPVGMVVASMPDVPLTPAGRASFDSPTKLARGETAVNDVNTILLAAVQTRHLVYADLANALRYLDSKPLVVGGVAIDMLNPSTDATHFFQDGKHPAAVGNGLFANLFLEALNIGYGTNYSLLSDLDILTAAGLQASYTGETSNIPYANFVVSAVPEPGCGTLAAAAVVLYGFINLRARRTVNSPSTSNVKR